MRPAGLTNEVKMFRADMSFCVAVMATFLSGQIADADFLPHILHLVAEKLKHVKLLPGSIKTQEGQAVKELSEASWESKASLWIACKWTGNKL